MISWFILLLIASVQIFKLECTPLILPDFFSNQLYFVKKAQILPFNSEKQQICVREYFNSQNKKLGQYYRCPSHSVNQKESQVEDQINPTNILFQKLNVQQYNYFYYQPYEENMYDFYFEICLDDVKSGQTPYEKLLQQQITFFFYIERVTQQLKYYRSILYPVTQIYQQNQLCKMIYVQQIDIQMTQSFTVQKFSLGLKLGGYQTKRQTYTQQGIHLTNLFYKPQQINFTIKSKLKLSQKQPNQQNTIINQSPFEEKEVWDSINQAQNNLEQLQLPQLQRKVNIKLMVYPLKMSNLMYNLFCSLFCILEILLIGIFIDRMHICQNRIRVVRMNLRNKIRNNNISHFHQFIPEQKFKLLNYQNGLQCSICLIDFEDSDIVRKAPCQHVFHKICLDLWCTNNLICPLCRKKLDLQSFSKKRSDNQQQIHDFA